MQEQYRSIIKWLEKVASGKIKIEAYFLCPEVDPWKCVRERPLDDNRGSVSSTKERTPVYSRGSFLCVEYYLIQCSPIFSQAGLFI